MAFSASDSILRAPRVLIAVAGAQLAPIEASVDVSLHQSADTFYAKLPLDNEAGLNEKFWADTAPIDITISGMNNAATDTPAELIVGTVDKSQCDFATRAVEIHGRDLTAKLTDKKTSEQWQNLSNKQIIEKLAADAGLTVQFGGDSDDAGLQYGENFTEISDLDAQWNVIVKAADRLGCIAFVKGKVLYIQPIDQPPNGVYAFTYQRPSQGQIESGNFTGLLCTRNLDLAKDASIEIQSWQHRQGAAVTSKYESKGSASANDKLLYQFRAPNLTKEQQDRIARNHLRASLTHERVVSVVNMAGDVAISPLQAFRLGGTQTGFDQDYILSNVAHRFQLSGYTMDVTANSQDAKRGDPTQVQ